MNSCQKGKRFERRIAAAVRAVWPAAYRSGDLQRKAGPLGCYSDIEGTPYWLECKHANTISLPAWHRQMASDQRVGGDKRPQCLIYRKTGKQIRVRLLLSSIPGVQVERDAWCELELSDWLGLYAPRPSE